MRRILYNMFVKSDIAANSAVETLPSPKFRMKEDAEVTYDLVTLEYAGRHSIHCSRYR